MRFEGPARGAATFNARAHQPWGTGGPAQAVVGTFGRACEGGCSRQGPDTPAGGDRESCPGGGECVLKGPRGGLPSPKTGHTSMGGHGGATKAVVGARAEGRSRGPLSRNKCCCSWNPARACHMRLRAINLPHSCASTFASCGRLRALPLSLVSPWSPSTMPGPEALGLGRTDGPTGRALRGILAIAPL